jgi:hypothetical protein
MSELDREMLRHLRAYRGETRPSAPQRDGALAGLLQRVREGDDVDLDAEPSSAPLVGTSRLRWAVAAAAVALVIGGTSLLVAEPLEVAAVSPSPAAAVYGDNDDPVAHELADPVHREPAPRSRAPHAPVVTAPAPAPLETIAPPIATPPLKLAPHRPAIHRAPPEPAPAPTIEPSIDAAEVAALRRAQALLVSAPADALARLVMHANKYPSSSLADERDIARATALCNLGRIEEAHARAQAFEDRRPDSPLLSRMRRICKNER